MSITQTETVANLNDETLSRLQQLVQINIDSANGFREAADAVDDSALASEFRVWAVDRTRQAEELGKYVNLNDEEVNREGSWSAAMHQTWIKMRAALNGGDPYVVLVEAERGEDQIMEKYEEVLKQTAGSAMNSILQRQYADVKSVHDRVRDLRDSRKSS